MIAAMIARVFSSSASSIESAVSLHTKLFLAYIALLIVAALATALFTVLVWHSGNKVQEAIRVDAEAKITAANAVAEAARRDAALANEGLAKSNEEIARLNEHTASLSLRIEEERRKRVEAEERLAEITKRLQRRSDAFNEAAFVDALNGQPKGIAACLFQNDDPEASDFAMDVHRALLSAGWTTPIPQPLSLLGDTGGLPATLAHGGATGGSSISLVAKEIEDVPNGAPAMLLRRAFAASGLRVLAMIRNDIGPVVRIIIGPHRP